MTAQPTTAPQLTFEFACGHEHMDYPDKYCTYPEGHGPINEPENDVFNMDHGNPANNIWWLEDDDADFPGDLND